MLLDCVRPQSYSEVGNWCLLLNIIFVELSHIIVGIIFIYKFVLFQFIYSVYYK